MMYEILGKIVVTIGIIILTFFIWLIGMVLYDMFDDYIESKPQWIKTTIAITGLIIIIGIFWVLYLTVDFSVFNIGWVTTFVWMIIIFLSIWIILKLIFWILKMDIRKFAKLKKKGWMVKPLSRGNWVPFEAWIDSTKKRTGIL